MSTFLPSTVLFQRQGLAFHWGEPYARHQQRAADRLMLEQMFGTDGLAGHEIFPLPAEWDENLTRRLIDSNRLPAAVRRTLVASWVLARLRACRPELISETHGAEVEGGGYLIDLGVARGEEPIAWFQLGGDATGVTTAGTVATTEAGPAIATALVEELLAEPDGLAACRWEIVDPAWDEEPEAFEPLPEPGARNLYGFNGQQFLGGRNVRERATR